MPFPIRVTWKNHDPSPAVTGFAHEQLKSLERYANDIVDCHVVIDSPNRHAGVTRGFRVTVDLHLPGTELVASHDGSPERHEDVHQAIRDAVAVAKKQLQAHGSKRTNRRPTPATP